MEELTFVDTIGSKDLGHFQGKQHVLVIQEYTDKDGKSIYNVSIEKTFGDDFETHTTDLFESEDFDEASSFYRELLDVYACGYLSGAKDVAGGIA